MTSIQSLRERFSRDPLPLQWGGIASDLLRLSSMAHAEKADVAGLQNVLTETKFFTEWLAPQVDLKNQEAILSLQRTLASFSSAQIDLEEFQAKTREWSDKILHISGLAA